MKKYELLIYEEKNPGVIKRKVFSKIPIYVCLLLILSIIAGFVLSKYLIYSLSAEIKAMNDYEPVYYISRDEMMPVIDKLNSAIVKINDIDVYSEEIFQVPFVQYKYDYKVFIGKYTKASRLFGLLHSDNDPEYVNILHLKRFSGLLYNELDKRLIDNKDILYLLEEQNIILAHTPSIWPTNDRITSGFGFRRSPFSGMPSFHEGTDMGAPTGTPIKSTADGVVVFAGTRTGYGYLVTVDHGFGYMTRYAHASALLVKAGDFVKKGDIIALIGSTGRSAGSHLHYEVLYNGTPVNSGKFLPNEGRKN